MKRSTRLNQELIFLNGKNKFNLSDLIHEFKISKRTALRDVEELGEMGLPYFSEGGKYGGYKIINQKLLSPVYFSADEIDAIFFALSALKQLTSSPFEKSYDQIRQKLAALLPISQQKNIKKMLSVVHYYSVPPINPPESLNKILNSILNEQIIELTYTQHETTKLKMQFNEIFYRDGIWFSSAYDIDKLKWGTYRCDYMQDVKILTNHAKTYSLAVLNKFQEVYEKEYHDIPFRCRLTKFGKEIFLKHHYPNMAIEEVDGTYYMIGGYNNDELSYMVHYLASFGVHMSIEYPAELKYEYKKYLNNMILNNNETS